MNSLTMQNSASQVAQIPFKKGLYKELELVALFYKAAHQKSDYMEIEMWVKETENYIRRVEVALYDRITVCSTVSLAIATILKTYVDAITRFERQFLMSCPCAVSGAGPLLKRLQEISQRAKLVLLYVEV